VEVKTEAVPAGNSVGIRASKGHSGKIHGLLHPSPYSHVAAVSLPLPSIAEKEKINRDETEADGAR